MKSFISYFIQTPSEEDLLMSEGVCSDGIFSSDDSGISNKEKWTMVKSFIQADSLTLFNHVDYTASLNTDDPSLCQALQYLCDLRCQLARKILSRNAFDFIAHSYYILNRQWYVRFREVNNLGVFVEMNKRIRLQ
jgi:hypothetical protein